MWPFQPCSLMSRTYLLLCCQDWRMSNRCSLFYCLAITFALAQCMGNILVIGLMGLAQQPVLQWHSWYWVSSLRPELNYFSFFLSNSHISPRGNAWNREQGCMGNSFLLPFFSVCILLILKEGTMVSHRVFWILGSCEDRFVSEELFSVVCFKFILLYPSFHKGENRNADKSCDKLWIKQLDSFFFKLENESVLSNSQPRDNCLNGSGG